MAISHKNGIALADLSAINGVSSISGSNGISATIGGGGGGGETAFITSATGGNPITDGSTSAEYGLKFTFVDADMVRTRAYLDCRSRQMIEYGAT